MNYKTIRQVAAMGILNEKRLRKMQAERKLPGIYSGSRFLVDMDMFRAQLQREAERNSAAAAHEVNKYA